MNDLCQPYGGKFKMEHLFTDPKTAFGREKQVFGVLVVICQHPDSPCPTLTAITRIALMLMLCILIHFSNFPVPAWSSILILVSSLYGKATVLFPY